jgi:hypothetical protein
MSDPTQKSADAEAMADYLEDVKNVTTGITAMRANFSRYVPKFPKERGPRYQLRRELSKMTNVFRDVLEGLASKPFSREVKVGEPHGALSPLIEDIDGRSNHLSVFAGNLFYQGISDAITWIRIDYPSGQQFQNREEELAAGVRPYWLQVNHADILEVKSERQGGGERITYVRLWEDADTILEMTPNQWTRYRKGESGDWATYAMEDGSESTGAITLGVVPLVPFITGRRIGKTWQFYPPMRDALDAQIELFVMQCALKFAETMTCFPILSANGVKPATDTEGKPLPLEIGPDAVLYAPPDSNGVSGSWSRVEPTTASLKHLADGIAAQIQEIRELGRQPLTAQSGNLTRISAATAASKGNSAVQQWAGGLKDALENALMITNLWLNDQTQPEVEVFTDFAAGDSADDAPATLIALFQARAISMSTLWSELQRIGRLSDNFDPEAEFQKIIDELPGDLDM